MKQSLEQAIVEQMGYDSKDDEEFVGTMSDVAQYGASGGYGQFVYYSDTCAFFQANKDDIVALAEQQAEEFGTSTLEMIAGFNSLNGDYSQDEIAKVIYGTDGDTSIENIMAWFALETLAYEMDS